MVEVERTTVAELDQRPMMSWGAVLAGLFFVIATSWLLFLLGSAIGFSIADASDMEAVNQGFATGTAVWLTLSSLVVFFLGALLTARLSGKAENAAGMLHGVTLWSVGTVLLLVLGSWGVGGLVNAVQSLASGAASATAAVGSAAGGESGPTQSAMEALVESPVMTDIKAQLKRAASDALVDSQRGRGQPSRTQGPARTAAAGNEQPVAATERELQRAMDEIDDETLTAVAKALVSGDVERAKNALAVNTSLAQPEVDAIVDGVSNEVGTQVESALDEIRQRAESVSTYTQAALWIAFVSAALGLAVSILGGLVGAKASHRLYAVTESRHGIA